MHSKTFYVPTLGPTSFRGEPSGWEYGSGGFLLGMSFGIPKLSLAPVSAGVSISTLTIRLSHLHAPVSAKRPARTTWDFVAVGAQTAWGTLAVPTKFDVSWSLPNWRSVSGGQIWRLYRQSESTLSTSHKPFAKTQELGKPTGLEGGFLLASYSAGQLIGSQNYNIMFCGAQSIPNPRVKLNEAQLNEFRYIMTYTDTHKSLDAGGENVSITAGSLQLL